MLTSLNTFFTTVNIPYPLNRTYIQESWALGHEILNPEHLGLLLPVKLLTDNQTGKVYDVT